MRVLTNKRRPVKEIRRQVRQWRAKLEELATERQSIEARLADPSTRSLLVPSLRAQLSKLDEEAAAIQAKIERRMAEYNLTEEDVAVEARRRQPREDRQEREERDLETARRRIWRRLERARAAKAAGLDLRLPTMESLRTAHDRAHSVALRAAERVPEAHREAVYEAVYEQRFVIMDDQDEFPEFRPRFGDT